jgi:hypothetical protein
MRKRSEHYSHIQNTNSQYNLPDPFGPISRPQNRDGIAEQFEQPSVQKSIAVVIEMIRTSDGILLQLEKSIIKLANNHIEGEENHCVHERIFDDMTNTPGTPLT